MKNVGLITILLFLALMGILLIFSLGSPVFTGKTHSETEPVFSVRILDFQSPVDLGGFMEFSYATRSIVDVNGTADVSFLIEKGGNIISSGSDTIFLGNYEERTRTANIFIPSDFKSGVYNLKLEVDYQGHMQKAYRTIEISVKGGFATVSLGIGKTNIIIISLLILFAILNIYLIYRLEKTKIERALQEEEKFIKRHKASILTIILFIILGVLAYYLNKINFLPGISIYYYLILGVLLLLVLFLERSKKHR